MSPYQKQVVLSPFKAESLRAQENVSNVSQFLFEDHQVAEILKS